MDPTNLNVELNRKSAKIALIFPLFYFLIAFFSNFQESGFVDGLTNGIVGGLFFGGISFLIIKSVIKNEVRFKWWQWIFYIIGWLVGFANLLFWLIMYGVHMGKDFGGKFINKSFHRRVYIWGIVMTILLLLLFALSTVFYFDII